MDYINFTLVFLKVTKNLPLVSKQFQFVFALYLHYYKHYNVYECQYESYNDHTVLSVLPEGKPIQAKSEMQHAAQTSSETH